MTERLTSLILSGLDPNEFLAFYLIGTIGIFVRFLLAIAVKRDSPLL
jgi:hypothetical protein